MNLKVLLFVFLVLLYFEANSQNQEYYTLQDGVLSTRYGNPDDVNAEYWIVRLYPSNKGSDYWGVIAGYSASQIINELVQKEENDIKVCKWSNLSEECFNGVFCYSNPLGPIAVLIGKKNLQYYDEMKGHIDAVADFGPAYIKISKYVLNKTTPFSNIGAAFIEYRNNLILCYKKLAEVQKLGDNISKLSMDEMYKKNTEFRNSAIEMYDSEIKVLKLMSENGIKTFDE